MLSHIPNKDTPHVKSIFVYSAALNHFMNVSLNLQSVVNEETVFIEKLTMATSFLTYASNQHYVRVPGDMFLAIRRNGKMKKGKKTNRTHRFSQFLMIQ